MGKKKSEYKKLEEKLKNTRWLVAFVVIYVILISVGNIGEAVKTFDDLRIRFLTSKQITDDEELYKRAITASQELLEFAGVRKASDPAGLRFEESWDEYTNRITQYSYETERLYKTKFLVNITLLRNEFLKRGITNKNLDDFYSFPTNYFGYTDIAVALAEMANQLNVSSIK